VADADFLLSTEFRGLYYQLVEAGASRTCVDALLADITVDRKVRDGLAILEPYRYFHGPIPGSDVDLDRRERMRAFYALSRVSDYLLLSFQGRVGEAPPIPSITQRQYIDLFEAFGFQRITEQAYSPFFHEIVEVIATDNKGAGIEIDHTFWPGLMFGDLLFARAGVRIRCHPSRIRKEYAETTLLCFAYLRYRRRAADLSLNWLGMSQWRTEFRLDYVDGNVYRFNVDGAVDISGSKPHVLRGIEDYGGELPIELRRELLVNRCFVSRAYPWSTDEDWPTGDMLTVHRGDPLVGP
jgi:hypothetical protein